jgi:pimeloyl-ACP methyl ester carboxylesterase
MVVFCGADHGIGMPLAMLHRWLSQWPLSLIYLRDSRTLGYLGGIEELGQDLVSTLSVLRSRIDELGARRIICYGASIGGYGALRYGLELGAETVICMSAMVNMRPEFNVGLKYRDLAERLQASFPDAELDLRQIYLSAGRLPKTWMICGEQNQDDRIHADHMAGIAGAMRVQVRGYRSHNPAAHLIRVGSFQKLLQRTIGF